MQSGRFPAERERLQAAEMLVRASDLIRGQQNISSSSTYIPTQSHPHTNSLNLIPQQQHPSTAVLTQTSTLSSNPIIQSSNSGLLDTNTLSHNLLQNGPTNANLTPSQSYLSYFPMPLQTSTQSTIQSFQPTSIPTELHTNTPFISQNNLQNNATPATMTPLSSVTYMPRQSHTFTRRRTQTETVLRGLFSPYTKTPNRSSFQYTQTFCCLAEVNCNLPPSQKERQILALSGLGLKRVVLVCTAGTFEEFNTQLTNAYPLLKGAHGFKLLRCTRSQNLIGIPIPNSGYSIPYLKGQRGLNKATAYIAPLQNNLPLQSAMAETSTEDTDVVKEVCQECSGVVPLFDLEKHIQQCKRSKGQDQLTEMHQSTSTPHHENTSQIQPSWSLRAVLVHDPFMDVYNSKDANKMRRITVPLALNAQQFEEFLQEEFPLLRGNSFELCRMDKTRRLHVLTCPIKTPSAIRALGELGRSALYIRPQRDNEMTCLDPDELSEDIDTESTSSEQSENMEHKNYSSDSSDSPVPESSPVLSQLEEDCPPVQSPLSESSPALSRLEEDRPPVQSPLSESSPALSRLEEDRPPVQSPLSESSPALSRLEEDRPPVQSSPLSESNPALSRLEEDRPPVQSPLSESSPALSRLEEDRPPVQSPLSESSSILSQLEEDRPPVQSPWSESSSILSQLEEDRPSVHSPLSESSPALSQFPEGPEPDSSTDINDLIKQLQQNVQREPPRANIINVYREDVLDCAIRAFQRQRFNAEARIDVAFVDVQGRGEGSVDEGGPRREFLRLLMQEIQHCKIFEGPEESRSLALLGDAVQEGLYRTIGKMISVAVVQGGLPINFFSERLYSQISALPPPNFTLEEVADHDIRNQLEKINTAGSVEEARAAISAFADTLGVMGAFNYIKNFEERDQVVRIALKFYLQDRLSQAITQLKEGLMTLGVLDHIVANQKQFKPVFIASDAPLTSADMAHLFKPIFSPVGSNRRRSENRTLAFWRDWLLEVEEGNVGNVKLEDILIFASGASKIPLAGFQEKPTITFLEPGLGRSLPTANTCSVSLNLPMCTTFNDFSEGMALAIVCAKTFGIA
ncbi:uncharacterized protein [Pseudorasbora parva]|uniref:uncharacterized protein isoform X2 n=1 Tax=Pseudorasbora parva TaxID=51549 RepID=UPI00351E0A14